MTETFGGGMLRRNRALTELLRLALHVVGSDLLEFARIAARGAVHDNDGQ